MDAGAINPGRFFTPNQADSMLGDITKGIAEQYATAMANLGLKNSGGLTFGLGFDTDPKGKADNRISSQVVGLGGMLYETKDRNVGRDDKRLQEEINLETQRMLLAALKASDLPKEMADAFGSVDIASATTSSVMSAI